MSDKLDGMSKGPERRLAAILAADVAGYSRLIEADEEGTHWRLQTILRETVKPIVEEHLFDLFVERWRLAGSPEE